MPRAASGANGGQSAVASIAGQRCPIIGRISMDLVGLDITDLPEGVVHRGDKAIFVGDGITIDDLASAAGTIGYEILTHLGPRCHRVYRGA